MFNYSNLINYTFSDDIIFIALIIYLVLIYTIIYLLIPKNNSYQSLLEFPQNYIFGMENITDNINDDLIQTMDEYCQKYGIYEKGVIVSLSGGVDSMVILACLINLQNLHTFQIDAVSINYNLRKESDYEINFLTHYLNTYHINHHIISINDIKRKSNQNNCSRKEYEEMTKNIRYNAYEDIINKYDLVGVMVGHHQDDIIENIFTNTMYGRSILDLEVMKPISTIKGIQMMRPFLRYHKQSIYDFAHKYNIPYFLDTTPKWSKRGKMRFEIFPLITDTFGSGWRNKVKEIGKESTFWGTFIDSHIHTSITKFSSIDINNDRIQISINLNHMDNFTTSYQYFHKMLSTIMHSQGLKMFSNKAVSGIIKLINSHDYKITLNKRWTANKDNGILFIIC